MPPINRRNAARPDMLLPDQLGQGYQHWQEPIGDYGIFNGQFDLAPGSGAPAGWPEGWEIARFTGGAVERITGGYAGNWCMRGGQPGQGGGGQVWTVRYFPIQENGHYYMSAAWRGNTATARAAFGLLCYDAAKAYLGATVVHVFTPGTSWVKREIHIGPTTDSDNPALFANTRYVRPLFELQGDLALTNTYTFLDDCEFSQLKATQSAKLYLEQDFITDATQTFTDETAFVVWPNSTMTLTLLEPGYIWYSYFWITECDAARTIASRWQVFVDGVSDTASFRTCSPGAGYEMPMCISGRSGTVLTIGAHTIDMRCQPVNAADTVLGTNIQGQGWYARGL